jgi:hypothetical protein
MAVHTHAYDGLVVRTGDVLCTVNGVPGSLAGRFWQGVGAVLPGRVDHCALYVGPGGRCVEAGARGVITFDMPGPAWDAPARQAERALLDRLLGVADPLAGRDLTEARATAIREAVAAFALDAAAREAGYNLNFFASDGDGRYYCSQLVYRAYLEHGIDLNTDAGVPGGPVLGRIVFPEEIWNACVHTISPAWPSPPSPPPR